MYIDNTDKYTNEDLAKMQNRDYGTKVNVTVSKILEALRYSDFNMFVAFSGGKDSSVLFDLVANVWSMTRDTHGNRPLQVMFANTSNEFVGMQTFVKSYCKYIEHKYSIPIHLEIAKGNLSYRDVILEVGYPIVSKSVSRKISDVRRDIQKYNIDFDRVIKNKESISNSVDFANYLRSLKFADGVVLYLSGIKSDDKIAKSFMLPRQWYPLISAPFDISDKCCEKLKKHPISIISKKMASSPFIGEMASDSDGRKRAYLKTGCNAFGDKNSVKSKPMGFWLEQDVLRYIHDNNIPIAPVYGELIESVSKCGDCSYKFTREQRTGCKLCMFGMKFDKQRFKRLKEYEPATMAWAMTPIYEGGLGYGTVINYMNEKCNAKIIL